VKPLLAPKELAARWRVNVATIYRMINRGLLPAFRVFRLWRIREDDVAAHEKQNRPH